MIIQTASVQTEPMGDGRKTGGRFSVNDVGDAGQGQQQQPSLHSG